MIVHMAMYQYRWYIHERKYPTPIGVVYIICYHFNADTPNMYDKAFRPDQINCLYKLACFHVCRTVLLKGLRK